MEKVIGYVVMGIAGLIGALFMMPVLALGLAVVYVLFEILKFVLTGS